VKESLKLVHICESDGACVTVFETQCRDLRADYCGVANDNARFVWVRTGHCTRTVFDINSDMICHWIYEVVQTSTIGTRNGFAQQL